MESCRILTPNDEILIPEYLGIFERRLTDIESFYSPSRIQDARGLYTPEYMKEILRLPNKKRFIGNFNKQNLNGILIEGHDVIGEKRIIKRTQINWIMAGISGQGIGTRLLQDCLERAESEAKNVVSLGVATQNTRAIEFYHHQGFREDMTYDEGRMLLMHYILDNGLLNS